MNGLRYTRNLSMGFDLFILLQLLIDTNTGLPIVYRDGENEKDGFHVSEYQVPNEYRKFIAQRGHWFHAYVAPFEGTQVSADMFLEQYPEWDCEMEEDGWTKEDHDEFRRALEWFSWKGNFLVSWS